MAIALEQTINAGTDTGNLTMPTWTPAANDLLLVFINARDNAITPALSGNGATWDLVASVVNIQNQFKTWVYRAQPASPQSGAITITATGNSLPISATAIRLSGTDTGGNGANAIESTVTNAGPDPDSAIVTESITVQTANAWALGFIGCRNRTFSFDAGHNVIVEMNSAGSGGSIVSTNAAYKEANTAGNYTISGTISSAHDWTAILLSVKPAQTIINLIIDSLTSATNLASGTISQIYSIIIHRAQSGTALDAGSLAQIHALIADALQSGAALDAGSLAQIHALIADALQSGAALDAGSLAQIHALIADALQSSTALDDALYEQSHLIALHNLLSATGIDSAILSDNIINTIAKMHLSLLIPVLKAINLIPKIFPALKTPGNTTTIKPAKIKIDLKPAKINLKKEQ
jgi:hypothetical protein